MKVPQGYKWTELGVIPEDWEVKNFSEVFDMYPNNTYPRDCMNNVWGRFRNIHYGDILIKYPTIVDMNHCDIPFLNDNVKVKPHKIVRSGDVIIADTAEDEMVGKCIEVKNTENFSIIAGLHTLFCRPKDIYASGWLGYFINSNHYHRQLLPYVTGIKVSSISRNSIQETEVLIPPFTEQNAIAEALSDVDALIAVLDKKIEKKRLIKQGVMQELLTGKKRLERFIEPWGFDTISNICEILDNKRIPLNDEQRVAGQYPYCGANGIVDYIDQYIFDEELILMAEDGGNFDQFATRPIAYIMNGKYWVNNHVHILKTKPNYHQQFIFYLLEHKDITNNIAGGTRSKLTKKQLEQIELFFPQNKEEQRMIASILSDMDKEIADLEARRNKYTQIKSGMMQKLLTGQIRLIQKRQARTIPLDAHIVAGHIVHKLHESRDWGRTKLQKSLHLIGYHCQLDLGNEYIRNTAGPDDQQLMNYIDRKFLNYGHVRKIISRDSPGKKHYNYVPTGKIDEIEFVFEQYSADTRNRINGLLAKIERMDLGRAEIISTLYAVWNNRLIKHEPISDDLLLADFYAWSDHKADFSRDLVLRGLDYMRQEGIIPTGWGQYIDKK